MRFGNTDDIYITVDTAIEGKVSHLGIDGFICCIIDQNSDLGFFCQLAGQVYTPSGVATVVDSQAFTADEHFSGGVGTANLQIVALSCRQICLADGLYIHTIATEIVVASVLAIDSIPAMRQVHNIPSFVNSCGNFIGLLCKCPLLIDIYNLSH